MGKTVLYMVVPCYNEEAVLPETAKRLKAKYTTLINAGTISPLSRILFVNDGSADKTWEIISSLYQKDDMFAGVGLSRNKGHQNAVMAGLMTAKEYADVVISMDADLQDDIDAIDGMLEKYADGCDVVYGVRSSRKKDTFFKRFSAQSFYRFMQRMDVDIIYNHADYRLMSRRVLDNLANFRESNLFLRAIIPLIGFRSDVVYYERSERFAGESKYPLKKMLAFAMDAVTSFSIKPLKMIAGFGFITFFISLILLIYFIIGKFTAQTELGWTSIICSIWMIGGLQIMCIGIIGEYVGKMFSEVKHRPRYIIAETLLRSGSEVEEENA